MHPESAATHTTQSSTAPVPAKYSASLVSKRSLSCLRKKVTVIQLRPQTVALQMRCTDLRGPQRIGRQDTGRERERETDRKRVNCMSWIKYGAAEDVCTDSWDFRNFIGHHYALVHIYMFACRYTRVQRGTTSSRSHDPRRSYF